MGSPLCIICGCSDERYRATVDEMPFQKLGISFIRDRQQNPQRLLLKIDGQDSLVQVGRPRLYSQLSCHLRPRFACSH